MLIYDMKSNDINHNGNLTLDNKGCNFRKLDYSPLYDPCLHIINIYKGIVFIRYKNSTKITQHLFILRDVHVSSFWNIKRKFTSLAIISKLLIFPFFFSDLPLGRGDLTKVIALHAICTAVNLSKYYVKIRIYTSINHVTITFCQQCLS